jgi:hypothetical protein
VDEDGAATLDGVLDEADGPWQMLADVFPGHVHHVDHLVAQFLPRRCCVNEYILHLPRGSKGSSPPAPATRASRPKTQTS